MTVSPYVCVLSRFSHVQFFATLDYSLPGSSVPGILQARILEWVAMPSSRDLPQPRIKSMSCLLCLLYWQAGSLPPADLPHPGPSPCLVLCLLYGQAGSLPPAQSGKPISPYICDIETKGKISQFLDFYSLNTLGSPRELARTPSSTEGKITICQQVTQPTRTVNSPDSTT